MNLLLFKTKRNRTKPFLAVLLFAGLCQTVLGQDELIRQSQEQADAKSEGCLSCHQGVEKMHVSEAVRLGCTDCHGGNGKATEIETAHVFPKDDFFNGTSANPVRSYTKWNKESAAYVKFVNPGDLRVAQETCGSCHGAEVLNVQKSMMTTSSMFWGGAAYNNGIVSNKNYLFGESYSKDGKPQAVYTVPSPTEAEIAAGVLPMLLPLPRWEITQVANLFRTFERGGKIPRINPSEVGVPNPFEEPGKPDMKQSDRGLGTQLRISSPVLNLHKTRLNDPHLSFLGTNDHSGDYRSSGCTSCHVIYANDRSPTHSGPYAAMGNQGRSITKDPTISKTESGHPLQHRFTLAIPSSQCMTCHLHQPNAFINTFFGYQMWDYETDGERMYPKNQAYPSDKEAFEMLEANPEEAVLRGLWGNSDFLTNVSDFNTDLKRTQFSDYHGHGWIFRAVFKKDRQGNLLDAQDKVIPWDEPHKFHGVVPREGQDLICDENCDQGQKAVHLKDIHAERGMHCIDCHFKQDNHGNGKLYGEFHNAIEVKCEDCHGSYLERALLTTSGRAAPTGGNDLTDLYTPNNKRRFVKRGKRIIQRSMIHEDLEWEVPQVVDSLDEGSPNFNQKAQIAKLMVSGGGTWDDSMDSNRLSHSPDKLECYSCHTSWVTNCFGCHLPQQANWKKEMNHFEGGESRNWTTYNPQVVRDDGFMLCRHAEEGKIVPARSSSALVLSSRNANREQVYLQQPPISAPGYSSQAFNPHFPHTVRGKETKTCNDCHLAEENDNNAWMAQLLLQGTNAVNFIGKFAYVATGKKGLEAVAVTESGEPQAVIGSYLHQLAYPDHFDKHLKKYRELTTAYHHSGKNILKLQLRGEYLYTANGPGGFRVFDVANIDNKGYSERMVTAPVSPLGQRTKVKTKYATAVALPTTMPIDTERTHRPENQEQWPIHPIYKYAYITDREEGLILVNVMSLVDGNPSNNFLKRALTFNPNGLLQGAVNLTVAGEHVYICCDAGLVVLNISDPLKPKLVAQIGAPQIVNPVAVAVQFRYALICDQEGVKAIDITAPGKPRFIADNTVSVGKANDIYLARTYAYVAGRQEGLVIIDISDPEHMKRFTSYTAGGAINDAHGVVVGAANASFYAYVADGVNGLRVIQLTSPRDTPGYLGFSPIPTPTLIATHKTKGPALALSKGLDRDRAVDESGNQVSVFGRKGSRPLNLEEQQRLYLNSEGKLWRVSKEGEVKVAPR